LEKEGERRKITNPTTPNEKRKGKTPRPKGRGGFLGLGQNSIEKKGGIDPAQKEGQGERGQSPVFPRAQKEEKKRNDHGEEKLPRGEKKTSTIRL